MNRQKGDVDHFIKCFYIYISYKGVYIKHTLKGGNTMDIAALSISLSQMKIAQQASVSVLKMAMDTAKVQAVDLTKMLEVNTKIMEQSVNPHLGKNIDIRL